jgi:chemotaxis protein methyltransferase CheR
MEFSPHNGIAMDTVREFEFNDRNFQNIRQIVREHTGINLTDAKRELVYSRLSRRLRKLKLKSFNDYCELLAASDTSEITDFINAITTNLTSFFREAHHFAYLAEQVIPDLVSQMNRSQRIRIWSAGCSTGEEPYSIAITLKESIPNINQWDVRILATDLDSNVIAHGETGVYQQERIGGLSKQRLQRWFLKGTGNQEGSVRVSAELKELITFRQLNLMHPWPMKGPFDVIFCRNVVIYFDKATQRRLFERFANILNNEGCLFVGHSESLFKVTDRFRLIGKTVYEKAV